MWVQPGIKYLMTIVISKLGTEYFKKNMRDEPGIVDN